MNLYKKYHISIGSNIGDRLINIQSSIDLIHSRIASLTAISSVYNSESIGFEGDDFYNICASFTTDIGPYDVMQQLLESEGINVVDHQVQNFESFFWDPSKALTP